MNRRLVIGGLRRMDPLRLRTAMAASCRASAKVGWPVHGARDVSAVRAKFKGLTNFHIEKKGMFLAILSTAVGRAVKLVAIVHTH
jgi:hypothetical protein